jgi:hypothetical protein
MPELSKTDRSEMNPVLAVCVATAAEVELFCRNPGTQLGDGLP